jgi:YHS domain-containing protein
MGIIGSPARLCAIDNPAHGSGTRGDGASSIAGSMTMAHQQGAAPANDALAVTVHDPVCGMTVDPATTPHHAAVDGVTWHFCSARCRDKFVAEPARYLAPPAEAAPAAVPEGTIWNCPMHPEIRQDHPGPCPICGMALEPATVTADSGPSPELADMTRRFWFALVLSLPVFVLEMGGHLFPALHRIVPPTVSTWIQFVLAVLRAWLGVAAHAPSQHVHVDRDGHRRGVELQRGRDVVPRRLSAGVSRHGRRGRGLFRGGSSDHRAGAARPGARTARARTHVGCDQGAAQPRAENRAADRHRRQ